MVTGDPLPARPTIGRQAEFISTPPIYMACRSAITFSENRGFQIGYSELFLKDAPSWQIAAHARHIVITNNLIHGDNTSPLESGGNPFDQVQISATVGDHSIDADPLFRNPADQDFSVRNTSRANKVVSSYGKRLSDPQSSSWWKHEFPPKLARYPRGAN